MTFIHNSSIDIALAAMACAFPLYGTLPQGNIVLVMLGMSVQLIYLFDHYWDNLHIKNSNKQLESRHAFILSNKNYILFYIVLLLLGLVFLTWHFHLFHLIFNPLSYILFIFLGIYFFLVFRIKCWPKEIATALIYGSGICFYSLYNRLTFEIGICFLVISANAFFNLIQNSALEKAMNQENFNDSMLQFLPTSKISLFIQIFAWLIISSCFIGLLLSPSILISIFSSWGIINIFFHLIFIKLHVNNTLTFIKYRVLCELLFGLPTVIYLIWFFSNGQIRIN